MKITSLKLETSHPTANKEAIRRCETALILKDKGDSDGAQKMMRPLWERVGERPDTEGLDPSVAAEVLLCVGILTGWVGSRRELKDAQEAAKNLITESITYYESVGDIQKIAAGRAEIAYCYWREGEVNEARIMLREALQIITAEGDTKARALLKLTTVEWSASRFYVALQLLEDNAFLFDRVTNHTVKGSYHHELAIVLRNLATAERRDDYFQRAISEYEEADHHYELANNLIYRAHVQNNLGFLLYKLSRFKRAHEYLDKARRLMVGLRDKVGIAQIDETRAQVLIAEQNFAAAESIARHAASVLESSGRQGLLADALITRGIALARLKEGQRAQFTFEKAIEVALKVGALNKAGLAALTMIEQIDGLDPKIVEQACDQASEWLAKSESREILLRVVAASAKIRARARGKLNGEHPPEVILNKCDLQKEVLKFEGSLIRRALAQANGSVTHAASMLTMSYQALAYIIGGRHKDLLKERSPVRRRGRKKDQQIRRLSASDPLPAQSNSHPYDLRANRKVH